MDGHSRVSIKTRINGTHDFYSDQNRVSIILNNLISNAIRYHNPAADRSFVAISIEMTPEKAAITVADNGIGIPGDKQARVFEMFYRLSAKSNGSGLGLYIVKETVQKLDGYIQLESEDGKETTFTVVLPNLIDA
jgi:signal transduction histidine kinase